jgi:hypothetical protein
MIQPEDIFYNELEVFRAEAESAIQFFYSYLSIHAVASKHKEVHQLLNIAPLFWNTMLGALQTSSFIALGRIFDQNSSHNIDRPIKIAQSNMEIFSKESLAERKRRNSHNADEWLDEYLRDVYIPNADDFRRLRRYIDKKRKIYKNNYRDIRHKIFAHKEVSGKGEIQALFSKANIQEIQKLLIFLKRLHQALWQLFQNGRKPTLRPARYSLKRIREQPSPEYSSRGVQELLIPEIENFLLTCINKSQQKNLTDEKKRAQPI